MKKEFRMNVAEVECEVVGEEMADIAGVGVIVGFVGQAVISLLLAGWVFMLSKIGNLDLHHEQGTAEDAIERKRLWVISDILMVGNDIQMVLGISYMVTVFAAMRHMDTYHLHLVFDIVSFVGVSNAAALVCWTFCASKIKHPDSKWRSRLHQAKNSDRISLLAPRYRAAYTFAAMFLALTVMLCVRLSQWSPDNEHGRCYYSHLVTSPDATHPRGDLVYVVVTAAWLLAAMAASVLLGTRLRRFVLAMAFTQFPVHLYMTLALRHANQGKLEGGEDEDGWDFGQTTAVVLLGVAVHELWSKGKEYYKFEREIKKSGLSKVQTTDSDDMVSRSPPGVRDVEDGTLAGGGRSYEQVPLREVGRHD